MTARGSSPTRWVLLVGMLVLGVLELVRGLGHLLSEDSAAARAGVAADSVVNADVVYLFAVIGGTQALIGILLVVAAVSRTQLRAAAVGLEAARCALTLLVGLAKPSTAGLLVGGVQDAAQLLLALVLLAVLSRPADEALPEPDPDAGRWTKSAP